MKVLYFYVWRVKLKIADAENRDVVEPRKNKEIVRFWIFIAVVYSGETENKTGTSNMAAARTGIYGVALL